LVAFPLFRGPPHGKALPEPPAAYPSANLCHQHDCWLTPR